jgi:hypothetical protein
MGSFHAFDRLLCSVAGFGLQMRYAPDGRLFAVAGPVASFAFPDCIPGGLVLPMIIAAADYEPRLVPNDLRADGKTGCLQAVRDRARVLRLNGTSPLPSRADIARAPGMSGKLP